MTYQPRKLGALHRYALTQDLLPDDWVGLWLLLDYAHDELGLEGDSLRAEVIATIQIVEAQLVEVGDVTAPGGFRPWALASDQVVEAIRRRWIPSLAIQMGDVCWLNNTSAGDALAETLLG